MTSYHHRETALYILCFAAAAGFFYAAKVNHKHALIAQAKNSNPDLALRASELLQNRTQLLGKANAPYTLIEFGDYECPPCRQFSRDVSVILSKHRDNLNFDFRNLPLTGLHEHAAPAALVGIKARLANKFWQVHKELFTSDLSSASLGKILKENGLNTKKDAPTVQKALDADVSLAQKIGVNETPSFILCLPDGTAKRIYGMEEVELYLR